MITIVNESMLKNMFSPNHAWGDREKRKLSNCRLFLPKRRVRSYRWLVSGSSMTLPGFLAVSSCCAFPVWVSFGR